MECVTPLTFPVPTIFFASYVFPSGNVTALATEAQIHFSTNVLVSFVRLSLLRYNANLIKMKNNMVSASQQLKAKLEFFHQSIRLDLERYSDQMAYGICMYCVILAWVSCLIL